MGRTVGDIARQGLVDTPMALADELAGLIRGSAKTTLGAPGDINEIARDYVVPNLPYRFRQILEKGLQNAPAPFPTSEELGKKWSPVVPEGADPYRKIGAQYGESVGSWLPVNPSAVVGMAGRTAGRGVKAIDKAIATSPAAGSKAAQRGVIKMPGGNWLSDHALSEELNLLKEQNQQFIKPTVQLERMRETYTPEALEGMAPEQRNHIATVFDQLQKDVALNKWIDANLNNYVKKQMGTEGDPIRKLAEEGITHVNFGGRYNGTEGGVTARRRVEAGFPEAGFGVNPQARQWEHASDVAIRNNKVGNLLNREPSYESIDPWLSKLDPESSVHTLSTGSMDELGFNDIVKHLKSEIDAGNIRPEQLNKVSLPDAVQSVFAKNEIERKAKEAAELEAVKANLSINPYKEYPSGHKWVELPDAAESPENLKTIKDIGCQGGWCTQQEENALAYGGTDPSEGTASKLYALLDPTGKPHIQVHAVPGAPYQNNFDRNFPQEIKDQLMKTAQVHAKRDNDFYQRQKEFYKINKPPRVTTPEHHYKKLSNEYLSNNPQYGSFELGQIKPFSNSWDSQMVADATKKNPNYRKEIEPMVQDFIRSGRWDTVDDLTNAGLRRSTDVFNDLEKATLQKLGHDVPRYITPAEEADLQAKFAAHYQSKQASGEYPVIQGDELPPPLVPNLDLGFKRGGKVNLEDQYRLHKLNGTILGTQYRN